MFKMDGIDLTFDEEAIRAVAKKAIELKTGARGLRTILENLMIDTMYDLPSEQDVEKVIVDENVVVNGAKPDFVPQQGVNMIKILEAMYKSAETGKEVIL